MMIHVKTFFPLFLLCCLFSLFSIPVVLGKARENANDYQLSLSFDLKKNLLTGTARIILQPGAGISLAVSTLTVTGTLLKDQTGLESLLYVVNDRLVAPADDTVRELFISYTAEMSSSIENIISPEGITLVSNWHPVPDVPMRFRLSATLPQTFTAVSETDHFPLQRKNNRITASFSQPVYSLHFAAGPYVHKKQKVREGLFVHSLFFAEEQGLADGYLKAAVAYINRYEKEIGPYPYGHYVIAASRLPSGFGIPGYTLIGQMVLRLPFIKATSLGHEILHAWFGNSVGVDYSEGNWCEGLTSYLADHSYKAEKGEGIQDRKETIIKYLSYNNQDAVITLGEFNSASHDQALARARRAVGYARGALLFHELKEKIGEQSFARAMRSFYKEYSWKKASWTDLRKIFETTSNKELSAFFQERLQSREIPSLKIEGIVTGSLNNKPLLSFTLIQQTKAPFSLLVPVHIRTSAGVTTHKQFIKEAETQISIKLDSHPLEIIIDPEYSFMRTLSPPELPAVWSRFMGDREKLILLASEKERETFAPLLQSLHADPLTVKLSDQASNKELGENSILFLGPEQPHALSLFSNPAQSKEGFTVDVRTNPLNSEHVAVLTSSPDKSETAEAANRLSHYGKYSFLRFSHGRILQKSTRSTQSGIRIVLDIQPKGGRTSDLSSFDQIIDELSRSRVIYIGETHNSLTDHRLQLQIIEALYAKDPNLVVGLEMFPSSKQPVLDDYISGNTGMDEQTFLKESEYFKVWGYDYRFYRDIINFAKIHGLPVRGLNLDKDIVSKVFRSGNTDGLNETDRNALPAERNLDMEGYRERLSAMHAIHMQGSHGSGSAAGFLQAQGLWDESMAENISGHLKDHPNQKMIVLAGEQHTRKDSGIPPRVKRRIDILQSSVLNIAESNDRTNLAQVADFFFISRPVDLPESAKIGIVLVAATEDDRKFLKISQISPHGKAGEAGLQEGDVVKEINGFVIEEMSDLQIAMIDARQGETVMIKIMRDEDDKKIEMAFMVELSFSPPPVTQP